MTQQRVANYGFATRAVVSSLPNRGVLFHVSTVSICAHTKNIGGFGIRKSVLDEDGSVVQFVVAFLWHIIQCAVSPRL
jgi:hypothetical protein